MAKALKIAGTSIGGSSYAARIMKAYLLEPDKTVKVIVTKGEYQDAVAENVKIAHKMIPRTTTVLSSTKCKLKCSVKKEK